MPDIIGNDTGQVSAQQPEYDAVDDPFAAVCTAGAGHFSEKLLRRGNFVIHNFHLKFR